MVHVLLVSCEPLDPEELPVRLRPPPYNVTFPLQGGSLHHCDRYLWGLYVCTQPALQYPRKPKTCLSCPMRPEVPATCDQVDTSWGLLYLGLASVSGGLIRHGWSAGLSTSSSATATSHFPIGITVGVVGAAFGLIMGAIGVVTLIIWSR